MTQTRIKICGITTVADARNAVDCGADAIGLVFYARSPRAVTVEQAAAIAAAVPPFVTVVALFVDEPADSVQRILSGVAIDMIQFHGSETAEFCGQFARPWIKALRVKPGVDLAAACQEYRQGRGILLDSWQDGVPGGTGTAFDWSLAAHSLSLPVVLAGGSTSTMSARPWRGCAPPLWMSAAGWSGRRAARTPRKSSDSSLQFAALTP